MSARSDPHPAQHDRLLIPGRTCWRLERAARAAVLVDGAAYFSALHNALQKARRSVFIVNWDINHRMRLQHGTTGRDAISFGRYLTHLAKRAPELDIRVLKWDSPIAFELKRHTLPFFVLDWLAPPRLRFRLDSACPPMACQHQKIVVIDDSVAFCGGLDLTDSRWDTRDHADSNRLRRTPGGDPYQPFHDMMMVVDGRVAKALGELVRERWVQATGDAVAPTESDSDAWPERVAPDFTHVDVAIARTRPAWDGCPAIREVEALYLAAIAAAQRCIYIENQYFASRRIYEAIQKTLTQRNGPEIVVVNPVSCPGPVEEQVMGDARTKIVNRLRQADRFDRFQIYAPLTAKGDPIMVHAKCFIMDDRLLRVGSANLSNRSMGFDSECDLAIEAAGDDDQCRRIIAGIRSDLLAEHLGIARETLEQEVAESGSLLAAIERLRRHGGRTLHPLDIEPETDPGAPVTDSPLDPECVDDIVPL